MRSDEELRFQRALAFYCAPALAGIKPADLFSWRESPGTAELLAGFGRELAGAGIRVRSLGRRGERRLVLVYRPRRLSIQLGRTEVRAQLLRDGYPAEGGPEAMLDVLERRLRGTAEFPHEVGLFLGYPAADVEGFRLHHGRDYLYSGAWKVYSDVEGAKRSFARYRRCRAELSQKLASGRPLALILPGATAGCE